MISGLVLDYAKDEVVDKAFAKLEETFTTEQVLQWKIIESDSERSTLVLIALLISMTLSLVLSNYLFWWIDVGFFMILFVNLVIFPYWIYKSIKMKTVSTYNKIKFFSTLSSNIKGLSDDVQESLKKIIR